MNDRLNYESLEDVVSGNVAIGDYSNTCLEIHKMNCKIKEIEKKYELACLKRQYLNMLSFIEEENNS